MQLMTFKACGGTSILLHYQSCYLSLFSASRKYYHSFTLTQFPMAIKDYCYSDRIIICFHSCAGEDDT